MDEITLLQDLDRMLTKYSASEKGRELRDGLFQRLIKVAEEPNQ